MSCHTLYQSRRIEMASCIGDVSVTRPAARQWEWFEAHFQDDGAYFLHAKGRTTLADANHLEIRPAGSVRGYSRPVIYADRGTTIRISHALMERVVAKYSSDLVRLDNMQWVVPLSGRAFRQVRALRRTVAVEGQRRTEERAIALLVDLMGGVARAAAANQRRTTATSLRHHTAIERAKQYLVANCRDKPRLTQLASLVGYAPHHFARVFRDATGLSPHRYLTEIRLRQAATRLDDGAENLSSMALDLGFASHSHFSTAFAARFRCSPAEYREKGLGE